MASYQKKIAHKFPGILIRCLHPVNYPVTEPPDGGLPDLARMGNLDVQKTLKYII